MLSPGALGGGAAPAAARAPRAPPPEGGVTKASWAEVALFAERLAQAAGEAERRAQALAPGPPGAPAAAAVANEVRRLRVSVGDLRALAAGAGAAGRTEQHSREVLQRAAAVDAALLRIGDCAALRKLLRDAPDSSDSDDGEEPTPARKPPPRAASAPAPVAPQQSTAAGAAAARRRLLGGERADEEDDDEALRKEEERLADESIQMLAQLKHQWMAMKDQLQADHSLIDRSSGAMQRNQQKLAKEQERLPGGGRGVSSIRLFGFEPTAIIWALVSSLSEGLKMLVVCSVVAAMFLGTAGVIMWFPKHAATRVVYIERPADVAAGAPAAVPQQRPAGTLGAGDGYSAGAAAGQCGAEPGGQCAAPQAGAGAGGAAGAARRMHGPGG